MEFDSCEAQDLNLENEKKYFIRWFCGLALLWGFQFAYSSSFGIFCAFFLEGGCICSRNRNDNGNRNRNLSAYEVGIIIFVTQLKCSQMQIANGKRQVANGDWPVAAKCKKKGCVKGC